MHRHIDEVKIAVFDTETTGLDPRSGDRIVEIACVKLNCRNKTRVFHSMVSCDRPVSYGAFKVNGITSEMLRGAPPMKKVLPRFFRFIQDCCLCCYNAPFDIGFLKNEILISSSGREQQYYLRKLEDAVILDILKMARILLPGLQRYPLWYVSQHLGFNEAQEHRALSDVELTCSVFNALSEEGKKKGINKLKNFSELFSVR